MTPLLSSRIFAHIPTAADLLLARRTTFFDLSLWMDDVIDQPQAGRLFTETARDLGVRVAAVHLPAHYEQRPLDLFGSTLQSRIAALDVYRRALDLARDVGARIAVVHLRPTENDQVWRLFESAGERGLLLALETDIDQHTSLPHLLKFLNSLGHDGYRHGLCVDLSRTHPSPEELRSIRRRIPMVEASVSRDGFPHRIPTEADKDLRCELQACSEVPYLTYEIVSEALPHVPPGEAELTLLLRRLSAWHRGDDGRTKYEGAGAAV